MPAATVARVDGLPGAARFAAASRGRERARARLAPLVIVVLVSVVVRVAVALLIKTPLYYPDEFLYSSLSRSIDTSGIPMVLGHPLAFFSFLSSVLVAPAWLIGDTHVAYRVAQAEGVVAFSLAAVPAYAIARRLGLAPARCLVAATAAVLVPDGTYSGALMSEPFAYPLFLTSILVALDAVAAPSRRRQAGVLLTAVLLCFARAQFVIFPLAYLGAAWAVSGRRSPRAALASQRLVAGAVAAAGLGVLAVGPGRVLGIYDGLTGFGVHAGNLLRWAVLDAVVLAIASGWVIVPGALVGLRALLRSRNRTERAFAALTSFLVAGVVLQAAVFGVGEGKLIERYMFYVAPLLVIGFLRGGPDVQRPRAALVGGMATLAALLPATGFFSAGADQAPAVLALDPLRSLAGGSTALVAAGLLVLLALAARRLGRGRRDTALLVAAAALGGALCIGASFEAVATASSASVPDLGLRTPATLIVSAQSAPATVMKTLFWNRGLERVAVLGASRLGDYRASSASIGSDGALRSGGRRIVGRVVFDGSSMRLRVRGGHAIRRDGLTIVADAAKARVAFMALGWPVGSRYLSTAGDFAAWPAGARAQTLALRLRSASPARQTMTFRCGPALKRLLVGAEPVTVRLGLPSRGSCWFGLTSGMPARLAGSFASVEVLSARLQAGGPAG